MPSLVALTEYNDSTAAVLERPSASYDTLNLTDAVSVFVQQLFGKCPKCQISLDHYGDLLESESKTCFMRMSNSTRRYLHKLDLLRRHLALRALGWRKVLLSLCTVQRGQQD